MLLTDTKHSKFLVNPFWGFPILYIWLKNDCKSEKSDETAAYSIYKCMINILVLANS